MSLRKQAIILGIAPSYLSMLVNGKRKWPDALRHRYEELVNIVVNTIPLARAGEKTATDTVVGGSGLEPLTSAMCLAPQAIRTRPRPHFPIEAQSDMSPDY